VPALLSALDRPAPIVLAPTGMVPTRALTPHVPLTPEEIARDVAAAAEIGITSVHLHARDADGGGKGHVSGDHHGAQVSHPSHLVEQRSLDRRTPDSMDDDDLVRRHGEPRGQDALVVLEPLPVGRDRDRETSDPVPGEAVEVAGSPQPQRGPTSHHGEVAGPAGSLEDALLDVLRVHVGGNEPTWRRGSPPRPA
jgi:hypothetical protein